jgi:hypothetical protein
MCSWEWCDTSSGCPFYVHYLFYLSRDSRAKGGEAIIQTNAVTRQTKSQRILCEGKGRKRDGVVEATTFGRIWRTKERADESAGRTSISGVITSVGKEPWC